MQIRIDTCHASEVLLVFIRFPFQHFGPPNQKGDENEEEEEENDDDDDDDDDDDGRSCCGCGEENEDDLHFRMKNVKLHWISNL